MNKTSESMSKTQKLTLLALLTAIVVVLQLLGSFIRFGGFSISLVLVPIVLERRFSESARALGSDWCSA